mmetsp:Transcript_20930/g.69872  ORF Transcript_20930/g.69872 Transcript_20930/m.69872 type:complete len:442 (-) Transcript_20930:270-1595(-)
MKEEGQAEDGGNAQPLPSQPADEGQPHSPEGSQHEASHRKPDAIDETGISFDISGSSQIGSSVRRTSRKNDGVDSSWHNMDGTVAGGKRNYFANRAILAHGPPRPKPNPADVKLMDSANISHEFYVPFSEIQWISNLSEGAMGEVHRVKWRGHDCAAKQMKGKHISNTSSQMYKDILKEIYIMSKIGFHPHIVAFYGVCSGPGGNPVILLELVNGPTLDHFLASMEGMQLHWRKQRPTLAAWTRGLLKGLAFLHDREPMIMHRDLKPGNLLLAEGLRTIKIADFGVSRTLKKKDRLQRTLTGMTGTRRYMAPEVYGCKQGVYTEKADIYSCTLVMWEIATGVKPFSDVPPAELTSVKNREKIRPSLEMVEWKDFAGLIEKGWNRVPESRPTALEMLQELEGLPGLPDPSVEISPMGSKSMAQSTAIAGEGTIKGGCSCVVS